jgi:hypothetical protein
LEYHTARVVMAPILGSRWKVTASSCTAKYGSDGRVHAACRWSILTMLSVKLPEFGSTMEAK